MARVFIGVGSNIDRDNNIRAGLRKIRAEFSRVCISPVYETSAVGFEGENFYNLVVGMHTDLTPAALQARLHTIEAGFGRVRGGPRFVSRTLDLDLLLYDDLVCEKDGIQLPRDDITKFAFVLRPLSEIAGDLQHPLNGERYANLWKSFEDKDQELWPVEMDL